MNLLQLLQGYEKDKISRMATAYLSGINLVYDENFKALDSQALLIYRDGLQSQLELISTKELPKHMTLPEAKGIAEQYKKDLLLAEQNELRQIQDAKAKAVEDVKSTYYRELGELEKIYKNQVNAVKASLREVYEPVYLVRSCKEDIEKFASANMLDLNSYKISYQDMPLKDIKRLTRLCTVALDEVISGTRGRTSFLKFLYWPLWKKFTNNDNLNNAISLSYLVLLLAAVLLTRPYVMGVISIVFIIQVFTSLSVAKRNHQLISAAYSISADFKAFDTYIESIIQDDLDIVNIKQEIADYKQDSLEARVARAEEEYDVRIKSIMENSKLPAIEKEIQQHLTDSSLQAIWRASEPRIRDTQSKLNEKYLDFKMHKVDVDDEIAYRKEQCVLANSLNRDMVYYDGHLNAIPNGMTKDQFFTYCDILGAPGVPVTTKYYMDTKIKSSVICDKDGAIMGYKSVPIPFENILMTYSDLSGRNDMIQLSRFLLSNLLGSVRENFLEISIIDLEGLGRDYPEFNSKDLLGTFSVVTTKWEDYMADVYDEAKSNLMSIGNKSFNQYNKDQSAENKTTLAYKLIIFVSMGNNMFFGNKVFQEFKNYSTKAGIWLWCIHPDKDSFKKVDNDGSVSYPEDIDEVLNWPIIFADPERYTYKSQTVELYNTDKYISPMQVTSDVCKNAVKELVMTMSQRSADIIWYEEEYRKVFIPDDKIWTTSSAKGVELHFGFYEGDRSDNHPEWFGSDGKKPVHCLMCGATGAGKSATINQVLANMLHQYSPEELVMIMIDFKNVEFGMYTDKSVPGVVPPSIIPHAKIIAGTTDGEYALSVFDYALKEMRVRQGMLGKYQFQSIEDWNGTLDSKYPDKDHSEKEVLFSIAKHLGCYSASYEDNTMNLVKAFNDESTEDKVKAGRFNYKAAKKMVLKHRMIVEGQTIMPRMVILCDEFQVMFTEVPDNIVDEIKVRITAISKLARFAGCHLWFTSQSMKGTMSQDILDQFALRCCLRCSKETSDDVLGNDAAFKYLRGRGFIYTNADKGAVLSNHKYTIPFAPNDYIKEYLAKLARKTRDDDWVDYKGDKQHGHVNYGALFYDEKFAHKLVEVDKWYEREEVKKMVTLILLGERTFYTEEKIPLHCIFQKADGEHMIICGANTNDRFYLANTLLTGCERLRLPFIVSCPDPELASLLDVNNRVLPGVRRFIPSNMCTDMFAFFDSLIELRTKKPEETDKPLFIFCLAWDKMVGLAVGDDYKVQDAFKLYIQKLGSLHIHLILTSRLSKSLKNFLPFIAHRVCAQSDEMTSYDLVDSRVGLTLSQDPGVARTACYYKDNASAKFKIYLSDVDQSKLQVTSIKIS